MAEGKATTVRFSDEIYRQLEQASKVSGLPINSIVVVACLEWLQERCGLPGLPIGPTAWMPRTLTRFPPLGMHLLARAQPGQQDYPFEMFSAPARRALSLAQLEAEKAKQSYIGSEHLLLGIAQVGSAGRILEALGLGEAELRRLLGAGAPATPKAAKSLLPTSRVRAVVRHAFEEAQAGNAAYVGTEHLLLGIVLEGGGRAAELLAEAGATDQRIRAEIQRLEAGEGEEGG
ncbi:MAG TPA: Clp protease N-terminal domain-containing protein [Candidatus Acidoferrales bacterium]|nr:Clp protease N-terminal domain-containing protein [Candidatus Acidoferrales bacterium]